MSYRNLSQIDRQILCSVCIATFRRPVLLANLLTSLEEQVLRVNLIVEIIVVDNDRERSAEEVFRRFQNTSQISFSYFVQPQKNISLTRNLAVEKSRGEYIFFIDDDEVASPSWLCNLLSTLEEYEADGVFGSVIPEFNEETPQWMRKRDLFYTPIEPTGASPSHKYVGNCVIKGSLLKQTEGPFDLRYGITGGEDTHLFDRLERRGARFVCCKEAWVREYLPPNRTKLSYLFLRGMKGGNAHTRRVIEFSEDRKIITRLQMTGKAFLYGSISLFLTVGFCSSKVHRTRWLLKVASNIGRFMAAVGWNYKAYR